MRRRIRVCALALLILRCVLLALSRRRASLIAFHVSQRRSAGLTRRNLAAAFHRLSGLVTGVKGPRNVAKVSIWISSNFLRELVCTGLLRRWRMLLIILHDSLRIEIAVGFHTVLRGLVLLDRTALLAFSNGLLILSVVRHVASYGLGSGSPR